MEKWEAIKGYEKSYMISNFGRVKSLSKKVRYLHSKTKKEHFRTTKEKILNQTNNKKTGYNSITLRDGNIKTFTIHRLVSEHFIINPENKLCVNHIDGNKTNNNVFNLEWCTHKENSKHAANKGLFISGEKHHKSFLTDNDILDIRKSKLTIKELSIKYDCKYRCMWQIVKGITR